jgi:hypothetical protein
MTYVETTLTAVLDAEDLIVRESRPAGIDGPIRWLAVPADLDKADEALAAESFQRITPWAVRKTYGGLTLEATLIRN